MAFIKYSVREFETKRYWIGVASFKISKSFDLSGYWLTEDIYERGWFIFGYLNLSPVSN